jgi:O-methyltransferase
MRKLYLRTNSFVKGLVLLARPQLLLGFLKGPLLFVSNLMSLGKWIAEHRHEAGLNDFFAPRREYSKRFKLYEYVQSVYNLKEEPINYLEFGVCGGYSFKWWVEGNIHPESRFYGFDTFEGLPEKWGVFYKRGDMLADVPVIPDDRAEFVKGLFQDTLFGFLQSHPLKEDKRKIIHMDADLFSSTLFVLTTLAPLLRKGDILLFDEFNVPNHEFHAFKSFTESYYAKVKLIGAVNNYYQVAMEII